MKHDEILRVVAAHRDGAEIEMQYHGSSPDDWALAGSNTELFNFAQMNYRVKRPKELWVALYGNYKDPRSEAIGYVYASKEAAEQRSRNGHGEVVAEIFRVNTQHD